MTPFLKMHGCGNDFIILDARKHDISSILASDDTIKTLCDRRFGIGCDQLIVITPHASATAEMLIRNPDASIAGMCGNAARCVADILMREQNTTQITLQVGTKTLTCTRNEYVTIDMGPPISVGTQDVGFGLPTATTVDVGNPHAVFVVEDAPSINLSSIGPKVETHQAFPNKTNVEFITPVSGGIRMCVWERGAGVTLACGSGACASAYAAIKAGIAPNPMQVHMDGGTLTLQIRESDGHILMSGPVAYVCEGTLTLF